MQPRSEFPLARQAYGYADAGTPDGVACRAASAAHGRRSEVCRSLRLTGGGCEKRCSNQPDAGDMTAYLSPEL